MRHTLQDVALNNDKHHDIANHLAQCAWTAIEKNDQITWEDIRDAFEYLQEATENTIHYEETNHD